MSGADSFVEITEWVQEKEAWLKMFLKLENGIASHDTYSRLFARLDGKAFESSFRTWVGEVLPALTPNEVVAIDEKTSRRSHDQGKSALHMVSAFASQAGLVLGQQAQWHNTEHDYFETVEKDHGRIETRRYWAFNHLECLNKPEQWTDLGMFGALCVKEICMESGHLEVALIHIDEVLIHAPVVVKQSDPNGLWIISIYTTISQREKPNKTRKRNPISRNYFSSN